MQFTLPHIHMSWHKSSTSILTAPTDFATVHHGVCSPSEFVPICARRQGNQMAERFDVGDVKVYTREGKKVRYYADS